MLDLLANALKLDEFLIALIGQFANEGAARLTMNTVKSLGLAIVSLAVERREVLVNAQATGSRRRKRANRRSPRKGTKRSRRSR